MEVAAQQSQAKIMLARYYGGQFGRFASPDPSDESVDLEQPQSWNRYSYVLNNPMNLVDPDGRMAIVDDVAIVGGIAVIVAVSAYLNSPSAGDPTRTNAQVLAGSIIAATEQFTTHFSANSAEKGVRSLAQRAAEHFDKVATGGPNDPNRNHWKKEIQNFLNEMEKKLKRVGPKAKKELEELLKRLRERLQELQDSGSSNPVVLPPLQKSTVNPTGGSRSAPEGSASGAAPGPLKQGAGVGISCPDNPWAC